jgi:hypothetical protein
MHNHDNSAAADVAAEIALWQLTALELPLAEVQAMVAASLRGLAGRLNDFNDSYLNHPETVSAAALEEAIASVARQATATAIFTLGVTQRSREAAIRN